MIQGIGRDGFAQAAIEAALRTVSQKAGALGDSTAAAFDGVGALSKTKPEGPSFESALVDGLSHADRAAKSAEQLPLDLLSGKISDFHEVAGQIKQAEIVFKFSLEVRNKLIDAYRETMRMSV